MHIESSINCVGTELNIVFPNGNMVWATLWDNGKVKHGGHLLKGNVKGKKLKAYRRASVKSFNALVKFLAV